MEKKTLLIWDFDDTIVKTNVEYERTNMEAGLVMLDGIGVHTPIDVVLTQQKQLDLHLVKTHGFSPKRYLMSWEETYRYFAKIHNRPFEQKLWNSIKNRVERVYYDVYETIPGAINTLEKMKQKGYPMVILTAGVDEVQRRKINEAGADTYIDEVYVRIRKTPETLREVMKRHQTEDYVMIGNSLSSDIHPALENDIWGFHIVKETWEADHFDIDENHKKYIRLLDVRDVPTVTNFIERKMDNLKPSEHIQAL